MFGNNLEKFIEDTPSFWGGVIIGIDGIPVEQRTVSNNFNLENMATEYITLLKQSNQINEMEHLGHVKEAIFLNQNVILVMRNISAEYYFLAAFDPASNLGQVRFKISSFIDELSLEFS